MQRQRLHQSGSTIVGVFSTYEMAVAAAVTYYISVDKPSHNDAKLFEGESAEVLKNDAAYAQKVLQALNSKLLVTSFSVTKLLTDNMQHGSMSYA